MPEMLHSCEGSWGRMGMGVGVGPLLGGQASVPSSEGCEGGPSSGRDRGSL
jgi:hypothetical protein